MDLKKLSQNFKLLAQINENNNVIVSCYFDYSNGAPSYKNYFISRVRELYKTLPFEFRYEFEQCIEKIEDYLDNEITSQTKGIAIFARIGDSPLFKTMQFRIPVNNSITVDTIPHLYELALLKDTYHRYVVLITTNETARIVEVCVGNVTKELWSERPELRKRVGREWTKEHYQSHKKNRSKKFVKEKIDILDRLMRREAHSHLIVAGNSQNISKVLSHLPKHLEEKLIDTVTMTSNHHSDDVIEATLSSFAKHEQQESIETATLFLNELNRGRLAVSGVRNTWNALTQGQVDVLVMSESFDSTNSVKCDHCGHVSFDHNTLSCSECGSMNLSDIHLREEFIRLAKQQGVEVEIVRESDILLEVDGIGCLLRYLTPNQHFIDTDLVDHSEINS